MTKHRFKTSPFWAIAVAAALGMGLSACGGGSSNDGLSAAQEAALQQQLADAEAAKDKAEADKAQAEADKKALEDANTNAMNATNRAAMVAKGKALYKALDGVASSKGMLAGGMLDVTVQGMDGDDLVTQPTNLADLKKQDAMVATMGDWMGAHYMKAEAKPSTVTTEARVYSNPGAATSVSAHDAKGLVDNGLTRQTTGNMNAYSASNWSTNAKRVMLDGLASAGTTEYEDKDEVKGSYAGATGTYICGADDCTAMPASGGGVTLEGTAWTFLPDPGAMVKVSASDYLYFGWWVRQDKDGPTHASAFYNAMGYDDTTISTDATGLRNGFALTGTAKYMGVAAGKFAINYGDTANGGHFTADAMLNAKFGDTAMATNGLSGTINNFRLNDGSDNPGWSVSLKRAVWNTDKYENTGAPAGTEWSIGGNDPAPGQAGNWEAQLFDENGKDDNNSPTTVVGKFKAGFGSTHMMVGAFGASQ